MSYITCREVADFLMLYLEHELAQDQVREFERHLAVCPPCVHYLRSYEQTVKLAKAAYPEAGAGAPEELVRAILAALKKGK